MTQRQAAQAARHIPFNPDVPLPLEVESGLRNIVYKQLRRLNRRDAWRDNGATRFLAAV